MTINKNLLLGVLGLGFFVAFVVFFYQILIYIAIAAFLSFLGAPIVSFLSKIKIGKFRIPKFLSALITLALMLAIIISFMAIFVTIAIYESKILSQINVQVLIDVFGESIEKLQYFLVQYKIISEHEPIEDIISNYFLQIIQIIDFEKFFSNLISTTKKIAIAFLVICLSAFFFLKDDYLLRHFIMRMTPIGFQNRMDRILTASRRIIVRYFWGLVLDASIVFILVTIVMYIVGVQNAFLLGMIAGILNVIPYIGPLLSLLLGTFIAVTNELYFEPSNVDTFFIIKIAISYVVINIIDGSLLQPTIYGRVVKTHPLEIFFIVLMSAQIAGIPGMILAIPTYSVLRIFIREFILAVRIDEAN